MDRDDSRGEMKIERDMAGAIVITILIYDVSTTDGVELIWKEDHGRNDACYTDERTVHDAQSLITPR
jgi:hypothetical protein